MASKWKAATIGDCFNLVGGYAFKSGEFVESGVPVIKIKNVKSNRMLFDDLSFVAPGFLETRADKVVKKGDLLITMSGNRLDGTPDTWVGKVAQFNESRPFLLNQRVGILRPKKSADVDRRFFSYSLSSHFYQTEFIAIATSSGGQANLSPSQILGAPIEYPPLAEQETIAAVLGALDDKIELNRRMNATLEAMARALFQSWFVDFDPARAKLDGRQPAGMDPATAALFPNEFEDSELGHIPKGWEVKTLGDLIELAYGKPLKAEARRTGNVCVYGANGPVGWHDEKLVTGPGIVVGRKGNPGVVTWAHGDFYPIDTTFYVEPIGACRSLYFLYYVLSLHNLANLSADSAVPGLNRNHAYMSKQVIPLPSVLAAFDAQIGPIFTFIHANEEQARNLGILRDSLLPKLLSGQVLVSRSDSVLP
jgi:type I restriction enzyme, S subunit